MYLRSVWDVLRTVFFWHSEGTHAEIYFARDVIAIFLSVIILMIISDGIISTLPARIQNFPQRHHPFDYGEDVQGVAEPTCKALLGTSKMFFWR